MYWYIFSFHYKGVENHEDQRLERILFALWMEPCILANSPQLPLRLAEAVAVAQLLDEVFRLFNDPFAPTVHC